MDAYGNIVTSYTGPATLTSSDPLAILPSPGTLSFTNGIATTSATLNTAGNQTVTVTDHGISGSSAIIVQATAVTRIDITGTPVTVTAGQAFSFTTTAKDDSGNVVTQYSGTLMFSSGDPLFLSPPGSPLSNGTGTFQATLETVGNWTITATDTSNARIRGTSAPISVVPGPFDHFLIAPVPTEVTAGVPFNFTVTAKDQFNNTVTNYSRTATASSSDPAAVLPGGLTFQWCRCRTGHFSDGRPNDPDCHRRLGFDFAGCVDFSRRRATEHDSDRQRKQSTENDQHGVRTIGGPHRGRISESDSGMAGYPYRSRFWRFGGFYGREYG